MFTRTASSRKIRNPRYCPEALGRRLNPSGLGNPTAAHVAAMSTGTNTPPPPPDPPPTLPDSPPVGGAPMPV